jgi:hypothetical protein
MHYACLQVQNNICTQWAEQVGVFPALSAEQGTVIGGSLLLCMATAWGFRFLLRFISNR